MTVVMKNRKNDVLPFPKPAEEEPGTSKIIAQIGSERFSIHIEDEDLPPVLPALLIPKSSAKKAASKIVNSPENNMRMETKFLRLRAPVELGSLFDDWQVCWWGGWSKHPRPAPSAVRAPVSITCPSNDPAGLRRRIKAIE